MEKVTLLQTRKKLSLSFAAIVFLIVLFLGLLFLSVRFVNEHRLDKARFMNQSNILLQELGQEPDILSLFGLEEEHFDDDFIGRKPKGGGPVQVSYLVLDADNSIVQKKLLQDIDFEVLSGKFQPGTRSNDGVVFRKEYLDDSIAGDKVIMYMEYRYEFEDYLEDVFGYIILSLIFGAGFYYVGLLFVGRALKPVEENMDDMQNFIHNAGHELKTPIAVIDSNLQLLSKLKKPDFELLTESRDEVSRLNRLVESLVDLADISSTTEVKNVDIKSEISSILSEYKDKIAEKKIKTHISFRKKLKLRANPGYVQIFFSNLIENAIKYNKKGGSIHITYDGELLSISDTGRGISKADQQKIFDRFYQTNEARMGQGFGIGLSLVKKIADTYDWNITLTSKYGKGSQFDIQF